MPSTSSPAAKGAARDFPLPGTPEMDRRLARLDRLAHRLDSQFSILGIRVGWDSILGLIPGVGDAVTTATGAYIIYEASQLGARRGALARMVFNSGVDFVIGGIPLIGDAFDVFWKANRRNIALLKREVARAERA